ASVRVRVNGETATLNSANYHLPILVGGVQIDCPITSHYLANSRSNAWGIRKDARLRVWPYDSPLIRPETFSYPANQRWFASATQMANEPVYVDGGEVPADKSIYYHSGLDIGGTEALVEVVAATDGMVVSRGDQRVPGEHPPVEPRYDVIYLLDGRGWYYRYSHLDSIDPSVKPGERVSQGQQIGVLGKEGASGGWSHLHFEIKSMQPSGEWGTQEGYAFLWESYLREYQPENIAVARPHRLAAVGENVLLDGSKSWSSTGNIAYSEWMLSDGSTAAGPAVTRQYDQVGMYSEILKIADAQGREAYDIMIVNVLDTEEPNRLPPTIHVAHAPTFGIQPGDPVTFKARIFRTTAGEEVWDFGDGTPAARTHSKPEPAHAPDGYATSTHRFSKPGHHLVRVTRENADGLTAHGIVHVPVGVE
ncbi:MAG TPA: PKD domain-containing protein, partial [bacterium]|nr:PKD domain-containing protein [bacterium]